MGDGSASTANYVVVPVLARRLVEGTVRAEAATQNEAFSDEDVERPVDRRRIDVRKLLVHTRGDFINAQVSVGLSGQGRPDELALAGQASTARAQRRRPVLSRMRVSVWVVRFGLQDDHRPAGVHADEGDRSKGRVTRIKRLPMQTEVRFQASSSHPQRRSEDAHTARTLPPACAGQREDEREEGRSDENYGRPGLDVEVVAEVHADESAPRSDDG
jgi:hypothetical protein